LVQEYQRGIVHEPVRTNSCAKCHLPHGIVGSLQLREYPPRLCFRCHQGTKVELLQPGVSLHKPVDDGTCDACHDSHNSD
jgi:predicted CXXCH cytochrome family protein